jgi:release factor glutamine methyltransferase
VGTDVSSAAVAIAARNRDAHALGERFELRVGATFTAVTTDERFDVIVSNPPYIAESERAGLAPEIVDWEPREALFGGADGLAVIREIVHGAGPLLAPGGLLALEVGLGQAGAVAALMEQQGYRDVSVRKDLAGRPRVVMAEASVTDKRGA